MAVLVVSTDAGDFAIQEHEILTITAAELCQLRSWRITPPCWLVISATVFAIASVTSSAFPRRVKR